MSATGPGQSHRSATYTSVSAPGMTWPPALPFALVLEQARGHDTRSLSLLYRRFLPVVYRYALARVGNVHLAEDLTSETFFAMIEQIGAVRAHDELTFVAWLLAIARNRVALHFRQQSAHPMLSNSGAVWEGLESAEPAATAEADDPLLVLTARESWGEIVRALNRLTDEQRAVVLYRCVLGYSAEEVGLLLGKQAGTIRALQFRALAALARYLGLTPSRAGRDGSPQRGRRGSDASQR